MFNGVKPLAGALAAAAVTVTLDPAAITLTGPSTAAFGASIGLTGSLTINGAAAPAGTPVTITRSAAGTAAKSFPDSTGSGGTFSLTDSPPTGGNYTYAASYPGSATASPVTQSLTVGVALLPTALTVNVSGTKFTYGNTVRATVHLGKTLTNRTVTLYGQAFGATSQVLLGSGRVDADGNLTFSFRATHSSTLSAVFSGDADYASETATTTIKVRAKVSESLEGYYRSKRIGSVKYRVFRRGVKVKALETVTPNKAGECAAFVVQVRDGSHWQETAATVCSPLGSGSQELLILTMGRSAPGHHFRVQAIYQPTGGDESNLGNISSWQYFIVS